MDLQQLSDLDEIRRLTYDYAFAWDTRRPADYAACFTEDGVIDSSPSDPNIPPAVGREAIAALCAAIIGQQLSPDGPGGSVHAQWNHRIDLDGDRAAGTVYFCALGALVNGSRTEWYGYYRDEYVRTPEGWRFALRELHPLLPIVSEGLDYEAHPAAG